MAIALIQNAIDMNMLNEKLMFLLLCWWFCIEIPAFAVTGIGLLKVTHFELSNLGFLKDCC